MNQIVIGSIALSFHEVSAGVFHNVLQHWGYEAQIKKAVHEEMFQLQSEGKVDLLMSAWLPGSHGKYLAPYEEKVIPLNTIYTPYCIWAVPEYIKESQVLQVADLATAEVSEKMDKTINGIGMGAGISRFSVEMISAYQLQEKGYHFHSNAPEQFYEIVEQKILQKRWFVIPLWHPQFLHHSYNLRALQEPKGLLRGKDNATPLFLKSSAATLKKEHLAVLSKITLGNQAIAEMEYGVIKKGQSAHQAARQWIDKEFGSVDNFIKHWA